MGGLRSARANLSGQLEDSVARVRRKAKTQRLQLFEQRSGSRYEPGSFGLEQDAERTGQLQPKGLRYIPSWPIIENYNGILGFESKGEYRGLPSA